MKIETWRRAPRTRKGTRIADPAREIRRRSGDFNPIHYDDEAARAGGLEGVIAHGMLSMGFLGHFIENTFGAGSYKKLEVRFQGMVKLGEVITCRGAVTDITQEKNRSYATCEIEAVDSSGRVVTRGEAKAWLD